jgi:hypothetical protein
MSAVVCEWCQSCAMFVITSVASPAPLTLMVH